MPMAPFPHRYQATATVCPRGEVVILSDGLRALRTQPPEAFGGPGDRWSPETLLVGAVADCYALTFRAVAHAARLEWDSLECEADGTLDRVDRAPQFTAFRIRAILKVPKGTSAEEGRRVLARAKDHCLVSNSLKATCEFDGFVEEVEKTEAA